ncbi:MAG: sulfite exporter TauE/SafE family protein [Lachnospiraceae bacterium]|nr:sulfite exporter TauE/SafE family protein [Lachnospiraceae bacterium]
MIDIYMAIAMTAAFIVKGLCGFANTLVFTSILSFHTSNINISPVEVLVGYPSNVIIVWKNRKKLDWKIWLPLALLVILGCIPGVFFLKIGNPGFLKILFGFVVIGVGTEMLLRDRKKEQKKSSKMIMGMIGVLSGLLCGIFGVGALLAAYVGRTTQDNSSFKGNLCIVFLIENTFRIILYAVTGIIRADVVKNAFLLMPFMLMGLGIGIALSRILNEKTGKRIIILMLILSGISLIISNV